MIYIPKLKYILPIFLFYSLCGFYFIVLQMALSHAPDRFLEVHETSKVPLSLSDNRLPLLDKILTPLISFFVAAFGDTSSQAYPTVVHFVWSFGCAIMLPLIEAERNGVDSDGNRSKRSIAVKLLSYPMAWGILYQRLSGGWIIPLWLIAFMQSGTRANGEGLETKRAESVLAGWWIGHTLPALVMLIPGQPALRHTPLWVAFPILMSLSQAIYLRIRTYFGTVPSVNARGIPLPLKLLYISGFIAAFLAHVHLLIIPALAGAPCFTPTSFPFLNKAIGLFIALYKFFAPRTGFRIPSPAETTATSGVIHFVQFDVLVVFPAVWTALLLDLVLRPHVCDSSLRLKLRWILKMVSGLLVGSLLLSPGAVTALLMMYREEKLVITRCSRKRKMTGPLDKMPLYLSES